MKIRTKKFTASILALIMAISSLAFSPVLYADDSKLEIFVSNEGSDSNAGSISAPFKSFDKALEFIKANKDQGKDIDVLVRGGDYFLAHSIDFTPEIWNSENNTLTFKPYGDEKVRISGAVNLGILDWQAYSAKAGVYVANIGTGYNFDSLIAGGTQQVLARFPNYTQNENLKSTISVTDSQLQAKVPTWADPAGGYIRALHSNEWGGNDFIITGKSGNTVQYTWVGNNNRGSGINATHRIFENIFEELDTANEWFYNKKTGELFFWPPSGMNLSATKFEGATLEQLITFKGQKFLKEGKTIADEFAYDYNCVKNIVFDGFTFEDTHRTLFTSTFERPLRGDWGIVRKGAIFMENSENISILNSKFNRMAGNGIMMNAYNKGNLIDFCDFKNNGASCVLIVGLEDSVRNPSHWDNNDHRTTMGDFQVGPRDNNYSRDITISNCYMYDVGIIEKQSSGICISIAHKINMLRNTIHRCSRAAINVSDGTFGGHEIAYNDLFDTVRETGDHGPFNSWGRDRFWSLEGFNTSGSKGEVKRPYALYDAIDPVLMHNNRVQELGSSFGIDLDDGSTNYEIYNNLMLGGSIKLREGFVRKVYNNVLIGKNFEKHCTYTNNDDAYYDNIIFYNKGVNIAGGESSQQTTTYDRNFYYNGARNTVTEARGNINTGWLDPMFVNPSKNDYRIMEGSPVFTMTNFKNFPMSDDDFGRKDAPKPSIYIYSPQVTISGGLTKFIDYGSNTATSTYISNILDEGMRSAAGLPDLNGVYFTTVAPGGYFASQGIQANDVIRSINGVDIKNVDDLYKAFTENFTGVDFNTVIYRNQNPMDITMKMISGSAIYPWTAGGVRTGEWQVAGGRNNDITYSGQVNVSSNQKSGDYYEYTFYGTGIGIMSERYTDEGRYAVYIDGEFVEEITGYGTTRQRQVEIYTKKGLFPGKHVLKVVNLENKWLILDGFKVYYDAVKDPFKLSATNGEIKASFPLGISKVPELDDFSAVYSVNGGSDIHLDLMNMDYDDKTNIVTLTFHEFAVGYFDTSIKVGISFDGSDYVYAPSFIIKGTATYKIYNDNPPSSFLKYTGTWAYSRNRTEKDIENDVHATRTNGAAVEFTFRGTGIDVHAGMDNPGTEACLDIYLDGVKVASRLDVWAPRYTNAVVYSNKALEPDKHVIKIVYVSATNQGWFNFDGFGVYNEPEYTAENAVITTKVSKIAEGYAANIPAQLSISNPDKDAVKLNLYAPDGQLIESIDMVNGGEYVFRLESAIVGNYLVQAVVGEYVLASETVVSQPKPINAASVWEVTASGDDSGKVVIKFNDDISKGKGFSILLGDVAIPASEYTIIDSRTIVLNNISYSDDLIGTDIAIKAVKFSLFPSFSFSISIKVS